MKTTKSKKKDTSKTKCRSSIQDYFKNASKESNVKSVYVQAVKEKLKSFDGENEEIVRQQDDGHASTTLQLPELVVGNNASTTVQAAKRVESITNGCAGCIEWREKYKELEKTMIKLSLRHTDQLMKYDDLLKTATGAIPKITEELSGESVSNATVQGAVPKNTVEPFDQRPDTFPEFEDVFTEHEVKFLESLPLDKKKDSTFILHCIKYAYKNNLAVLRNRTLKGTLKRIEVKDDGSRKVQPGKDPLSPEKVKRIEQLFIKRVSKSKCLASEYGERVVQTNINKLIAAAIKNVSHAGMSSETVPNQNGDLNL